jgi:AraC-like DNA-binding protein
MIDRYTRLQKIKNGNIAVKEKVISSYPTHWHEFYEIELILSGRGSYVIDGRAHSIKKNMLFFMTPVNFHEVNTEKSEVITLMFMGEACDGNLLFRLSSLFGSGGVSLSDEDAGFLASLMRELKKSTDSGDEDYNSSLIGSILGKISKINSAHTRGFLTRVQKAMLYIQNNFRNDIRLADIASAADTSPTYLSGIFAKECGVSLKEYISNVRYEYAKKLLEYSDMSITDICFESGFCDYANFERRFKERFQISPSGYRRSVGVKGYL